MTVTPQNHPRALPVIGTAIAIVVGVLLVNRLSATSSEARPQLAASQATVGVAAEKAATPAPRVRYQATIDNWRRFRELNNPN
jgi:hypothetical protein